MRAHRLPTGFWLSWLLGMAWCLYRALVNEAWILDDELSHFLISQDVWSDSKELWHPWSRPGRNLLQVIPSYFGITVARLWTLALAGITVWLAGREALSLRLGILWMLPLLICFQWWFPELSYPVLTQSPFMMVWFLGVFLARRKHLLWAALCWGYLPLIRHEGIALSGLWGLWVIFGPGGFAKLFFKGKWHEVGPAFGRAALLGVVTLSPLIVMNVMTWWTRGELPVAMFFEAKPTEYYGSGPIWWYLAHLLWGAGLPVVVFLGWGMFRPWRDRDWSLLLYWTYPAYLVLHTFIFWKGLFASGGYYHFIMPMAPWIGLVALKGIAAMRSCWGQRPVVAAAALTVYGGLLMLQQQWQVSDGHIEGMPEIRKEISWIAAPPMRLSRFGKGLEDAASWLHENREDEPWLSHHVAVSYFLSRPPLDGHLDPWGGYQPDSPALKRGTLLVWDSHYSTQSQFGFSLERLAENGWVELGSWAHGTVRVFRKN